MDLNRSTTTLTTVAALALAAIFAVPAIRHWRERPPAPPPPPQPLRTAWIAPDSVAVGGGGDYLFGLAIAPDGRRLVYPAALSGAVSLWLHDLRNGETRVLPGTDGAVAPFWSSDGSKVGFFANAHVRALDLASGQASDLGEASSPRGGSWNHAGDVIFAPSANGGLMRRSAGGSVAPFTTLDAASGETAHLWPAFLADGKHCIFLVTASQPSRAGIWIASVDDPASRKRLVGADSQAIAVDRTLLYLRDQVLVAQPIDPQTNELSGRAEAVTLNVGRGPIAQLFASASSDVLITGAPGSALRQLKWVSRDGEPIGSPGEPVDAWDFRIAPDGKRVAVTEVDRQLRTLDVFIRTGSQPAPTRLSMSTDVDESPVWSPDGLRVAWAGQRRKIVIRGAGAVLPEQTIATFDTPVQVWDWSSDGKSLLIGRKSPGTGDDLWIQPPIEGRPAQPYAVMPFDQTFGVISPDGHAIAYASNESGQFDIYVDAFPKPATRTRVTTAGGTEPRWSDDGKTVFFRRQSAIHAVALSSSLTVDSVVALFDLHEPIRSYDVSRDGRFLVNMPVATGHAEPVTLITNWQVPKHN
jgi:Tol biopolymer transport system component